MSLNKETKPKICLSCLTIRLKTQISTVGCPRGVMIKAVDCGVAVSEFELQLRYYVYFRTNTVGKDMNPLSSQLYHHYSSRRMALAD